MLILGLVVCKVGVSHTCHDALLRRCPDASHSQTDDSEFTRTVHLFDAGYVDPLGVVSLMEFIETSFGIELREEDLFDERFATIDGMSGVIADRLSSHAPRGRIL